MKIVLLGSGSTIGFYSTNPGNVGNALVSAFIFLGLELNISGYSSFFFFSSNTPLAPQSELDIYYDPTTYVFFPNPLLGCPGCDHSGPVLSSFLVSNSVGKSSFDFTSMILVSFLPVPNKYSCSLSSLSDFIITLVGIASTTEEGPSAVGLESLCYVFCLVSSLKSLRRSSLMSSLFSI